MLLLSFHRGVTESHRAREICFRAHQKCVGKQDFKSSPVFFLPASPVCSEQEGSKVPLQFLLTLQPELHPAPHNPSFCSPVHIHFHHVTLLKSVFPLSRKKKTKTFGESVCLSLTTSGSQFFNISQFCICQ